MTVVSATGAPSAAISTPTAGTPTSENKRHAHLSDSEDRGVNGMVTSTSQGAKHGSKTAKQFQDEALAIEGDNSLSPEQKNVKLHALRREIVQKISHESEGNGKVKNKHSIAELNKTVDVIDATIHANTVGAAGLEKQRTDLAVKEINNMGDLSKVLHSSKPWTPGELKQAATYVKQVKAEAQAALHNGNLSPELRKDYQQIIRDSDVNLALIQTKLAQAA
jgi:hypothetical protein